MKALINPGLFILLLVTFFSAPIIHSAPVAGKTRLVADINKNTSGSTPNYLIEFNSKLYFQANDGVHGPELWVYYDNFPWPMFLPAITNNQKLTTDQ